MEKQVEEKIKQICTYHGDEGTSGYCLSNEQFSELFNLISDHVESVRAEEREKLRGFALTIEPWIANVQMSPKEYNKWVSSLLTTDKQLEEKT